MICWDAALWRRPMYFSHHQHSRRRRPTCGALFFPAPPQSPAGLSEKENKNKMEEKKWLRHVIFEKRLFAILRGLTWP